MNVYDAALSVAVTHTGMSWDDRLACHKSDSVNALAISRTLKISVRQTNYALKHWVDKGILIRVLESSGGSTRYLYRVNWSALVEMFTGLHWSKLTQTEHDEHAQDIFYHLSQPHGYSARRAGRPAGSK